MRHDSKKYQYPDFRYEALDWLVGLGFGVIAALIFILVALLTGIR
jgi:hypothetical protein